MTVLVHGEPLVVLIFAQNPTSCFVTMNTSRTTHFTVFSLGTFRSLAPFLVWHHFPIVYHCQIWHDSKFGTTPRRPAPTLHQNIFPALALVTPGLHLRHFLGPNDRVSSIFQVSFPVVVAGSRKGAGGVEARSGQVIGSQGARRQGDVCQDNGGKEQGHGIKGNIAN